MIIKLVFKTVVVGALVLAGWSYVNYLKTGRFAMPITLTKPDFQMPKMPSPSVPKWVTEKTPFNKDPVVKIETAYKWQDEFGKWHYATEPPPTGITFEKIKALP